MSRIDPEAYEAWFDTPLGRIADRSENKLIDEFVTVSPGDCLLDAGCGTGRFTALLSRRGVRVVGLDSSREMLQYARLKHGVRDVVQGDAAALPFAPGSFDIVAMLTVLEFLASPDVTSAETLRVLSPSGRIFVAILNRRSPWGIWRRVRGLLGNAFWRSARLYSCGEMTALLRQAGFVAIRSKSTLCNSYVLFSGLRPDMPRGHHEPGRGM